LSEPKYEIVKKIAELSNNGKWKKEINVIKWNGGKAKLDIRSWAVEEDRIGKGITLNHDEASLLAESLTNYDSEIDLDSIE